ncbi:4040_t:CDS:1 [Paraglomus occultum]|uniref:4039_t:CDS:1 n=1 Tax=Paraglomus occultum TaxID=144539 RepID=A0A9N8WJK8_9GLOM|nr:4039_t:CDS:1 [Paraglomus occultum]CAG8487784.1 4040_t:CDS:1 [Paraglomus occultum]
MSGSLPPELLTIILNECINDRETLHSCILINKDWSRLAVLYLWANPFKLLYKKKKRRAKQQIIKQGENLMTTFVESFTDMNKILDGSSTPDTHYDRRSTFDYSLYLQELDFGYMRRAMNNWLSIRKINACEETLTLRILMSVMQHSPRWYALYLYVTKAQVCTQLSKFFTSVQSLPQLKKFAWASARPCNEVFASLSKVAQDMESITIHIENCDYKQKLRTTLASFLSSQRQLKSLKFRNLFWNMSSILQLLSSNAHTLESVSIESIGSRCDDEYSKFIRLHTLKSIDITQHSHLSFSPNNVRSLTKADLPNLQSLVLAGTGFSSEVLMAIIRKHKKMLTTLKIGNTVVDSSVCLTIRESCQSLENLSVVVSEANIAPVADMIGNLPNLHSVKLTWDLLGWKTDVNELFNALASYYLPCLYKLEITQILGFQPQSLQNFLSKSKPPLKALILDNRYHVVDEHLKVILDNLGDTLRLLRLYYNDKCKGLSEQRIRQVARVVGNFKKFDVKEKFSNQQKSI